MIDAMKQALAKFEHLWEIGIDAEYKVELLPEIEALRQAIYEAEFDKAFDEYAESDEGKARTKAVFAATAEQSVDALIEHIKNRQQVAK
jgi:hypothetical protein